MMSCIQSPYFSESIMRFREKRFTVVNARLFLTRELVQSLSLQKKMNI